MTTKDFAATYHVHNDDEWFAASLESIYPVTDRIYIFLNSRPWNGPLLDNSRTRELIAKFPDPDGKIEILHGEWPNEVDQRNYSLEVLAKAGYQYEFLIDADEIYDTEMLGRMMQYAKDRPGIDCWHCWFVIYWKSPGFRIDPPEKHNPPIFLKVGTGKFVEYRNCKARTHELIPAEIGYCHHMSYARSDEQIRRKLQSFSHSHQVRPHWFEEVWKGWDNDHTITDLCPYNPGVFHRAVPVDPALLPAAVRRMQEVEKPAAPVGNWKGWYEGLDSVRRYGDTTTYRMAAQFLSNAALIEDWGCGGGGFREFCTVPYRGIDGTKNKFVDEVVDLCTYRSSADAIMMRHVLEHNYRWPEVLDNALASFQRKMCLILFTPFSEKTTQIHFWEDGKVPDLSLSKGEIEALLNKHNVVWQLLENIPTDSQYKQEHVYLIMRKARA